MKDEQEILQGVLESYGLAEAKTQLLGSLWNRVYRVEANNGHLYSLRLCPPAIKDNKSLEEELVWLELLASQQQVRVPRPVRNQQQALITTLSTTDSKRLSCLFEWVEGEPAKQNLTPSVMRQIGQTVARLHQIAHEFGGSFQENDFRLGYRYGSSLVTSHRDWIEVHQAEIGVENVRLLDAAVTWLIEELKCFGETRDNFGIIHADLHFGNFLVQDDQVSVIDFDQLGCGHYLYDLAVLMVELFAEVEDWAERWTNFRVGYQQIAALPFEEEREIEPFVVAVNLAFLDWVYNSPNPAVHKQMGQRLPATFESIRARIGV
jgi:Ser/Thr protein kinase RdoA (MazF antagonist)